MAARKPKRRQFWHKQWHVISADVFGVDVMVVVNMAEAELRRLVSRKMCGERLERVLKELGDWDRDVADGVTVGRLCGRDGPFLVLLHLDRDRFRVAVGTIVHEMVHVAQYLLRERRVPLSEETEEVHAYLTQHLVTETLKRLY